MRTNRTFRCRFGAFSLIEVIGTLAVISILVATLVPSAVRQLDLAAGDQETKSLKTIANAFESAVQHTLSIPSNTDSAAVTNWAAFVATELGVNVSDVLTSKRSQPRFFLIDPALSINGQGLPYQQTRIGATNQPVSVRLIILSSIGQALTAMSSGVPSSADFNAIWDWNDSLDTPPSATILSGLTRGSDLKVQRLNLGVDFVQLLLTAKASHCTPGYAIGRGTLSCTDSTDLEGGATGWSTSRYYIQGTVLSLFSKNPLNCSACSPDSEQVLIRDTSFIYNQDVWRDTLWGASSLGGLDVLSTVDKFLKAYPNANARAAKDTAYAQQWASTNQQVIVVTAVENYMDAYVAWANSGFASTTYKNTAVTAQAAMMTAVQGLYQSGGGSANYAPSPVANSNCLY